MRKTILLQTALVAAAGLMLADAASAAPLREKSFKIDAAGSIVKPVAARGGHCCDGIAGDDGTVFLKDWPIVIGAAARPSFPGRDGPLPDSIGGDGKVIQAAAKDRGVSPALGGSIGGGSVNVKPDDGDGRISGVDETAL